MSHLNRPTRLVEDNGKTVGKIHEDTWRGDRKSVDWRLKCSMDSGSANLHILVNYKNVSDYNSL
jgi:hypothetical protein